MINFDVNTAERAIITEIAARAIVNAHRARLTLDTGDLPAQMSLEMDITAVHQNGNPLRLRELLQADDFNFNHDVFGIYRHLDRKTGKLAGFFTPRFSQPSTQEP